MDACRLAVLAKVIVLSGLSAKNILGSLSSRIRLQKIVFLLASSGLVKELAEYRFTLYVHGPYSPGLADDYYRLADKGDTYIRGLAEKVWLSREAVRVLKKLVGLDTSMLEVMATLYDIVLSYHHSRLPPRFTSFDRIYHHLRMVKPWISKEDAHRAWQLLKSLGLLRY